MLLEFLDKKPLFYDTIDYTRMPRAYASIKHLLNLPKIIHIIGTNGKGSTGRFIAQLLHNANYSVGHYTSPHIINFNERIWIDGANVTDQQLNDAHTQLLKYLQPDMAEELSYFEYTTLLAMVLFQSCDYVVLEAGLGGEHDATAVFHNHLTVVTPIGFDHQSFLGNTLKEITTTKLRAIKKEAIIAQQPHKEVMDIVQEYAQESGYTIRSYTEYIDSDDIAQSALYAQKFHLASYLQENLKVALAVLHHLSIPVDLEKLQQPQLFGRCTRYANNIILDVGHNPLAAQALLQALKPKRYILVYNTYKDKEYTKILTILAPIILRVEIITINDARAVAPQDLYKALQECNLPYQPFTTINEDENYLVFGSFSVVEAFLRRHS